MFDLDEIFTFTVFRRITSVIVTVGLFSQNAFGEIRDSIDLGGRKIFTEGPIRHRPATWRDRVFVGSDDGFLYCLNAATGDEIWKIRGGPSNRKALGAGRLISAWPISGGPVVHEDRVYFAAGIWPFMGVFIYALDARTGEIVWINDRATNLWKSESITEQRPDQPDFEPSFISVTPMGQLSIGEDGHLIVPCGRAEPARFNLETGQLLEFHYGRHKPHQAGEGNLVYSNYDEVVASSQGVLPANPETRKFLGLAGVRNGYALVVGADDDASIDGLVSESRFRVIVVDPDQEKVTALRSRLDRAGVHGERVSVHAGDIRDFGLPPYFANLIIATETEVDDDLMKTLFRSLRPYGGVACFPANTLDELDISEFPGAEIQRTPPFTLLKRTGALPGADSWSHEFANAANTQSTGDDLVRSPFAVLWFGGPAAEVHRYYENHRTWAIPKVAGGRFFVEGPRLISAFDVYTGESLWEWRPPEGDKEPWSYQAKEVHLVFEPLAGRTAATEDAFYIVSDRRIHALDARTGIPLHWFEFEERGDWGGIRIAGDTLFLATANRVVAVDRRSGHKKWEFDQAGGSLAIGGGKVFCIQYPWPDRYNNAHLKPESRWMQFIEDSEKIKRRGGSPELTSQLLIALDAKTGEEKWRKVEPVVRNPVRRLIFSGNHDLLFLLGNGAVLRASDGEKVWRTNLTDKAVLAGDHVWGYGKLGVIANLSTRTVNEQRNPITLETQPFRFSKTGNGCGPIAAGRHILTLRSGSAAYFDLGAEFSSTCGVVNLGAFRSSCQASLIPADGLLVSPNSASGGCTCRYPAATALAMVHAPEMEKWGAYGGMELNGPIRKLGINLGAPGDRMGDDGVLWLDHPSVGGPSPTIEVQTVPAEPLWFRGHPARVKKSIDETWVAASGAESLESVRVTVGPDAGPPRSFRVRVIYLESLETTGPLSPIVKEIRAIEARDGVLEISLDQTLPVCGIELIENL